MSEVEAVCAVLRRATHDLHERLERLPVMAPLTAGCVSAPQYLRALARLYGFYAPMEAVLFGDTLPDSMGVRPKSPALLRDLSALGLSGDAITTLPHCTRLPALSDPSQRLGALYVLEGATLGGRVVLRRIADSLGELTHTATNFHGFHGDEVGPWWKYFQAELTERLRDQPSIAHATHGATATFDSLGAWLEA
ncbi:biliverdin-producing heme oxygenase [Paramagnetospirillum kuznetsovii]|uniref:biliverdin-producing heme oxygenase n=1 Tax=Paramagnetospirillum kuznetsovii TaxID=2053833 RepID=UPI0013752D2C|nr:biliverdin-producing heme oxygenase [Paramagnetospirillum kuznetsovii]